MNKCNAKVRNPHETKNEFFGEILNVHTFPIKKYFCEKISLMISVEGMEFYAFHGCTPEEKQVGIRFEVDVHIVCNLSLPAQSDAIEDALNYQTVYGIVAQQMQITSNLIEHVAQRIKNEIVKQFPQAENVSVRVSKMNPPLGGKVQKVSVML